MNGADMAVDTGRLNAFLGRFVDDLGATMAAGGVVIGHRLGLYRALADGEATPDELAARTGTHPRYVAEWLRGQAAGGYVEYDAATGAFALTEEQAFALTDPDGPLYVPGAFVLALGSPPSWIPALDGVAAKLNTGAAVADVGCGLGASTVLLAQAYPRSRFAGSDYHGTLVELARKRAAEAGVDDRATFEVATAQAFPGSGYDLVATFDCLHDMGDPAGAARHVRDTLAPDGTWMIVEPYAGDTVADNLNPVGRVFYNFSTYLCVPNALS